MAEEGPLSAAEIHAQINGGGGPSRLEAARESAQRLGTGLLDRSAQIDALHAEINEGWQGEAGQAAGNAAVPLAQAAKTDAEHLNVAGTAVENQLSGFHTVRNTVVPVSPEPPRITSDNFMQNLADGNLADHSRKVGQWMGENQVNIEAFAEYHRASTANGQTMPSNYAPLAAPAPIALSEATAPNAPATPGTGGPTGTPGPTPIPGSGVPAPDRGANATAPAPTSRPVAPAANWTPPGDRGGTHTSTYRPPGPANNPGFGQPGGPNRYGPAGHNPAYGNNSPGNFGPGTGGPGTSGPGAGGPGTSGPGTGNRVGPGAGYRGGPAFGPGAGGPAGGFRGTPAFGPGAGGTGSGIGGPGSGNPGGNPGQGPGGAGRGTGAMPPGAPGAGGAGSGARGGGAGGMPMGAGGGGGKGKGGEDEQHKRAAYLKNSDPDATFGPDPGQTTPAVIGEPRKRR